MIRTSFNVGWTTRPKPTFVAEFGGAGAPWQEVTLPHDAMIGGVRDGGLPTGGATGYFPGGVWEYRRSFRVPEDYSAKRVVLEFEGVYRDAMVYLNGDLAAHWAYGYSGFAVRADPFLRYGADNVIRVEARAHQDSRWYSGAGLYRGVNLLVGSLVHIALDGVRVVTRDVDAARAVAEVATTIENEGIAPSTLEVLTEVRDGEGTVVAVDQSQVTVLPGEPAVLRQRLYVRTPALWSPNTPSLYTVQVTLRAGTSVIDEDRVTVGIRTIQLDPDLGLRLNGATLKLRGACIHHDNGVIGAATIARAEERRVALLKEAGFNALRSAHHPMSRALLDACDRLGMLVMDETFDMWTQHRSAFDYALHFSEWWERDVEAMIRKDFNHPSVLFYSLGNEIPELGSPHGAVLSRRMAEKIRSLDGTRFITNGVNGMLAVLDALPALMSAGAGAASDGINTVMTNMGEAMNAIGASELVTERTAEAFAVLDVAGMNYLDSRYEADRTLFPNRVIVGSETFPARIDVLWSLVKRNSHVIGDFTWTGWDYLGEAGIGKATYADEDTSSVIRGTYPWLTAWTGDLDITGHRRPQSYNREIVFGRRAEPYIAVQRPASHGRHTVSGPWSWTDALASWSWTGSEGAPVTVEVYSDAEEVELLRNGASLGRRGAGEAHRFRATFETTYEPGDLLAVAHTNGAEQGRTAWRTATGPMLLAAATDRATLRGDDTDLAFVTLSLVDSQGTVFAQADQEVAIVVTGPAVLQGFGSGNPRTAESFTDRTHTTFDGRALAVIRPTGPGRISVVASAPGCQSIEIRLEAV